MERSIPKGSSWVAAATLACLALVPASGAAESVGVMNVSGALVDWTPVAAAERLVLRVSGPGGFVATHEFAAGASPTFSLFDKAGQALPDGVYKYELWSVPQLAQRRQLERARAAGEEVESRHTPRIQSGAFTIRGGSFVSPAAEEAGGDGPAGAQPDLALRDQVIPDDLIVQGSICAGFDCVNNEDFGFDTIRLKENNTRIQFNDTSTTTGFPTNNWQIRANSSASGGTNFLGFVDQGATGFSETGTIVFAVEAGAAANSLYVDTGTRVGVGTSTPVLNLHVNTSNTPALRLEQNSSGGFTAQTWDVAGNEANFFVRDVTSGSTLPFRIRPGAPSSSIDIAADGDVGIGTAGPNDRLDIEVGSANGGLTIESATDGNLPQISLIEPTRTWRFRVANNGTFVFNDGTAGTSPVQVLGGANSNLLIIGGTNTVAADADRVTVNGELFIGSSQVTPDYVFESDYPLESIEEHAAFMWRQKHLPAVGGAMISGDQHLINVGAHHFGMLEELEKAHVYIEQLHHSLEELRSEMQGKDSALAALEERLARLESPTSE